MNEDNEIFGFEKLTQILNMNALLTSEEITNQIFNSVNTFRGTADVNDDMTMVIVKVE